MTQSLVTVVRFFMVNLSIFAFAGAGCDWMDSGTTPSDSTSTSNPNKTSTCNQYATVVGNPVFPLDTVQSNFSMTFQVKDCNHLPVAGLTASDFFPVEHKKVTDDYAKISSSEASQTMVLRPKQMGQYINVMVDFSGSIYTRPEVVTQLKEALKSFAHSVLDANKTLSLNGLPVAMRLTLFNYGFFPVYNLAPSTDDYFYKEIKELASTGINGTFFSTAESVEAAIESQMGCTASHPTVGYTVDSYDNELRNDLSLCEDPTTNLYGAAKKSILLADTDTPFLIGFSSPDILRSSVIFTDGRDEAALVTLNQVQSTATMHSAVKIYAVGLKSAETNEVSLKAIGKDKYFSVNAMTELSASFTLLNDEIKKIAGSYYEFSYCSAARTPVELIFGAKKGPWDTEHPENYRSTDGIIKESFTPLSGCKI